MDSEQSLRAKIAAHSRWARTPDRTAATSRARQAADARFERQVDPSGSMDPAVRARLAENARKAYFTKLALRSAQARKARRKADQIDAEVARELAELAEGGEAAC